jgi:hypothetical protein
MCVDFGMSSAGRLILSNSHFEHAQMTESASYPLYGVQQDRHTREVIRLTSYVDFIGSAQLKSHSPV